VPNPLCSLNKGFVCFQISAMGHCASAGGAIPDGTVKKNPHLFLGDGKDAAPNPCLLTKGSPPACSTNSPVARFEMAMLLWRDGACENHNLSSARRGGLGSSLPSLGRRTATKFTRPKKPTPSSNQPATEPFPSANIV